MTEIIEFKGISYEDMRDRNGKLYSFRTVYSLNNMLNRRGEEFTFTDIELTKMCKEIHGVDWVHPADLCYAAEMFQNIWMNSDGQHQYIKLGEQLIEEKEFIKLVKQNNDDYTLKGRFTSDLWVE